MYLLPEFIEMARQKVGKEWPTPDHKVVAENIGLGNPRIRSMESLMDHVRHVINIPAEKIRTITLEEFENLTE